MNRVLIRGLVAQVSADRVIKVVRALILLAAAAAAALEVRAAMVTSKREMVALVKNATLPVKSFGMLAAAAVHLSTRCSRIIFT